MNRALGFLFVLMAGIGFGLIGIFSRIAFQSGLSVGELLSFRFLTAAGLLWTGLLLFKPHLIQLSWKQILVSAALGAGGYAVFSTLYFKSIEGISVPLAALLLFTFPIYVNLGSHFLLKEKLSRIQIASLVVACTGLTILLWGPLIVTSKTAVLFGLSSGIAYSIYVLVSGRVQKNVFPLSSSLYVITAAALILTLIHQPSLDRISSLTTTQITCILGLAVVSTIGPLTFFLAGLQRLPSSQASIIVMIEPVVAALAAGLILGENLNFQQLVGAAIILSALILNALDRPTGAH
jgi:drug/metabolite transporter (DMT)-like permease